MPAPPIPTRWTLRTPSSDGIGSVGMEPGGGAQSWLIPAPPRSRWRARAIRSAASGRAQARAAAPIARRASVSSTRSRMRVPQGRTTTGRRRGAAERRRPRSSSRAFASWWCSVACGYGTRIDGRPQAASSATLAAGPRDGDVGEREREVHPLDEAGRRGRARSRCGVDRVRDDRRGGPGPVRHQQLQVGSRCRAAAARRRAASSRWQGALAPADTSTVVRSGLQVERRKRLGAKRARDGRRPRRSRRGSGCRSARSGVGAAAAAASPRTSIATARGPPGGDPVHDAWHAVRLDQHERGPGPTGGERRRRAREPADAHDRRPRRRRADRQALATPEARAAARATVASETRSAPRRPRGPRTGTPPPGRGRLLAVPRADERHRARTCRAARVAAASAGKTWPPVPPPATTTFIAASRRGGARPAARAASRARRSRARRPRPA